MTTPPPNSAAPQRYTRDELLQLRNSPLVRKPDGLPSIEQWMESVPKPAPSTSLTQDREPRFRDDPVVQRKRSQARDDAESALRFAGPMTLNRRNKSQTGDDIVLGPPNTNFASKRPQQPPAQLAERSLGILGDDPPKDPDAQDKSRKIDGVREKGGALGGRRARDGTDDPWAARKPYQAEDFGTWEDRDRERRPRIGDPRVVPLKRSGVGRGFFSGSWIRPEDGDEDKKEPAGRDRGVPWRDGARDRTRDRKDWSRPSRHGAVVEDDPEWMDDAEDVAEDRAQPTQEDFEKWKEEMKAKKAGPAKDKEEISPQNTVPRTPPSASQPGRSVSDNPLTAKTESNSLTGPLSRKPLVSGSQSSTIVPTLGSMFGTFEDAAKDDRLESPQVPQPKAKSRFEGLFKRDEQAAASAPPPAELQSRSVSSGLVGGDQPDNKDFNRILAMLGSKGPGPQTGKDTLFDPPRRQEERPAPNPDHDFAMFQVQDAYARDVAESHARINERIFNEQRQQQLDSLGQPSRFDMQMMRNSLQNQAMQGNAFPQMHNAGAPHRNVHRDSEFLLQLMHRQQREGVRPSDMAEMHQFRQLQKGMEGHPQHLQGPRQNAGPAPPPGLMEAHRRLMNEQEIAARRGQAPPPFFDHPDAMANMAMAPPPGLARRNTGDNARLPQIRNAPASNLGIPSLQLDELHHLRSGAAHMGVDGRLVAAPPPGLIPGGGPSSAQPPSHGNGPMGPLNGPFGAPFGGPLHGPLNGQFPGQFNGPLGGPVHGHLNGPPNGPFNGPLGGPLNGPGPGNGPLNGLLDGPLSHDKPLGGHHADAPQGPPMGQQHDQMLQQQDQPEQQDQAQHHDHNGEQPPSPQQLHQQDPKMQLQQPPPGFPHGMPPPRSMHGMPVGGPPGGPHGLFGPSPPHMGGHPFFGGFAGGPPPGPPPQSPLPPPPPGSAAAAFFSAAAARGQHPPPFALPPDMRDGAGRGGYPGM